MKNKQEMRELRDMPLKEFREKLQSLRAKLFSTRINSSTTHVKDYSQFKKLRKQIARIITIHRERWLQENFLDSLKRDEG